MSRPRKCVIAAPYWRQPGHLGCLRVARFLRWLEGIGTETVVIRAGSNDRVEVGDRGLEVTIRDPIGFYTDLPPGAYPALPLRSRSPLRRFFAYALLIPDPLAPWSRRAARHPLASEHSKGADTVMSSSPPESVHVAAEGIARRLGSRFIMDLRDGWLDEPTIPMLGSSALQRMRHGRLERRLMDRAERIIVTSDTWRYLLVNRLGTMAVKTHVVTNACPTVSMAESGRHGDSARGRRSELTLLYAGKVSSSRAERRMVHLFEPLESGLRSAPARGRLVFVGNLGDDERSQLDVWDRRLRELGWRVEVEPPVDHGQALQRMRDADGLLLLSSSKASIPAKLFDYLAAGRPILAVAPKGSEVWTIGQRLPGVSVVGLGDRSADEEVRHFIDGCASGKLETAIPEEFSDDVVRGRFLDVIRR